MRKTGFITRKDTQQEILPKSYRVEALPQRRKMVIMMINEILGKKARFDTRDASLFHETVPHIFQRRIFSHFQGRKLRPETGQRVRRIYSRESKLFNHFFAASDYPAARMLAGTNRDKDTGTCELCPQSDHPAAELIGLIFDGRDIRMSLDLDTLFATTVFRRIKREPSKRITLDMPYIHIEQDGVRTRLHPRWKSVDPERLECRRGEIEEGLRQLRDDAIDQCYLVYPKTDLFRRHIQVKDAYTNQLKMIPYSFTFSLREKPSCCA